MVKEWARSKLKKMWKGWQEAAEAFHQMKLDEGCECCRRVPICEDCYRCFDRNCNAGCIFCNPQSFEVEICPCCRRSK